MGQKVLVTGGRDYDDEDIIYKALTKLHKAEPITLIIQGWARGVDQRAHWWAVDNEVESTGKKYKITSAMWKKYGKGAGPLRNRKMYDESSPDTVIGFHGGNGTADMLSYARQAECPLVLTVSKTGEIKIS